MDTQTNADDGNVVEMTPPSTSLTEKEVISQIEANNAEIDKINAKAKEDRAEFENDNKAIKKRYKSEGGNVASINTEVKNRRNIAKLDAEDREAYDQLTFVLYEKKEMLQ